MLKLLRRLLLAGAGPAEPVVLQQWAHEHGHRFRRVHAAQGCVIEGQQGAQPWRIEWGASQRSYIDGFELRMIAELDLPHALMAMVLNRSLMALMEQTVYEQFVDDVQTRIDTSAPSEMRWLVMYTKLGPAELGRLQGRYGAVCSVAPWLQQWLTGPLSDALLATVDMVRADQPVTLRIARGRLTLRTLLPHPDTAALAVWFSVFEQALREARRLGTEWRSASGAGLTTQPNAWSNSELVRGAAQRVIA